jgi:enamine deaminase RidA (YjgF/YER057c/UK114 family)
MSQRMNIASGAKWEPIFGYSRAVRVDNQVWVAGTAPVDENGALVGPGDAYAQASFVFRKIEKALVIAGATLRDVVRTRMYLTDIAHQDAVGRAHHDAFGDVLPVATMVQISGLVDPAWLVEVEVDAIIS